MVNLIIKRLWCITIPKYVKDLWISIEVWQFNVFWFIIMYIQTNYTLKIRIYCVVWWNMFFNRLYAHYHTQTISTILCLQNTSLLYILNSFIWLICQWENVGKYNLLWFIHRHIPILISTYLWVHYIILQFLDFMIYLISINLINYWLVQPIKYYTFCTTHLIHFLFWLTFFILLINIIIYKNVELANLIFTLSEFILHTGLG